MKHILKKNKEKTIEPTFSVVFQTEIWLLIFDN